MKSLTFPHFSSILLRDLSPAISNIPLSQSSCDTISAQSAHFRFFSRTCLWRAWWGLGYAKVPRHLDHPNSRSYDRRTWRGYSPPPCCLLLTVCTKRPYQRRVFLSSAQDNCKAFFCPKSVAPLYTLHNIFRLSSVSIWIHQRQRHYDWIDL